MSYGAGFLAGQRITAAALNNAFVHTIEYDAITTATGTVTTVETVYITTASVTLVNGRAYKLTLDARVKSSVTGDTVQLRVRRTNISGTVLADSFRVYLDASGIDSDQASRIRFAANTTGADITGVLVATYVRASGTGNVSVDASGTTPAYLQVDDVGLAADYPGATAIV